MHNPQLGKKLESYHIQPPNNYQERILSISDDFGFSTSLATGLPSFLERFNEPGKSLNAAHIVAYLMASWGKMVERGYPKADILTVLNLMPAYLQAIITDQKICSEAISFLEDQTAKIRRNLE